MKRYLSSICLPALLLVALLTGCRTPEVEKSLKRYAVDVNENFCLLKWKNNTLKLHPNRQYAVFNSTPVRLPVAPKYDAASRRYSLNSNVHKNIVEPLLRTTPPPRPVRRILLDPGHGGHDSGAVGAASREKDLNLALALEVRKILLSMGFQVMMTRSNDVFIPLAQRPAMIKKFRADLFVSIHHNSSRRNPNAAGCETFVRNAPLHSSTVLAAMIQQKLKHYTGAVDRGVKFANFAVLRNNPVPAVLVEAGFVSNAAEERFLLSPYRRRMTARAIAEGISDFSRLK